MLYMVCHGSHPYTPNVSIYTSTMDPSWIISPINPFSMVMLVITRGYYPLYPQTKSHINPYKSIIKGSWEAILPCYGQIEFCDLK